MAWYNDDIQDVPTDIRLLFENYSGIPTEEVVPHVLKVVGLFADGVRFEPLSYQFLSLLATVKVQSF